jgi:hypothetical protein
LGDSTIDRHLRAAYNPNGKVKTNIDVGAVVETDTDDCVFAGSDMTITFDTNPDAAASADQETGH